MANKHLKKLTEEFRSVVESVSDQYGVDMGIAICIMTAAVNNDTIEQIKGIPEDFDWSDFEAKYIQYKAEC